MRSVLLLRAAVAGALLVAPAAHAQQKSMLPERDRPLALRATPVYTVGVEDGREAEMFSNVDQVAFDAQDNLYVLDRGNNRVQVFDRTGRFVRQVGKKGGGPGEFQAPLGLAVTTDGTLVVADLGHRSYSLFGRDGRFQRSVPFGEEWMPTLGGSGMAPHPRGGIVTAARQAPSLQLERSVSGTVREKQATPILWEPLRAGAKAARLYNVEEEVTVRTSSSPAGGGERRSFTMTGPAAFTPRLNWSVLPGGGLVVANTAGYTVKVVGADGRIARYIQKPMRVRKVTERDRDRERERMREMMASGRGMRIVTDVRGGGGGGGGGGAPPPPRQAMEDRLRNMQFAEVMPAIQNVRLDGAGRLWIERTGEAWGSPGPIDLVTVDGRYLGTVTGQRLPSAFSASGRAAYVERDDLGVERVVVKQLPRL